MMMITVYDDTLTEELRGKVVKQKKFAIQTAH